MSSQTKWIDRFLRGAISRREFVERAAAGGLGVAATMGVLKTARALGQVVSPGNGERYARHNPDQTNLNPYEEWLKAEGVPVYRDYSIASLRALELGPWARLGARGAHIDLKGGEGVNQAYVCELAPGGSTKPQRYMFEEVMYVLSGQGESLMWVPGGEKAKVAWQAGSVLAPPLNVWRQHVNRGSEPVRFVAITNAPVVIDLFHNLDFVFNNEFVFRDRYDGDPDFFGAESDRLHQKTTTSSESEIKGGVYTWLGAFVPDARTIGLAITKERGAGNSRIELQLADNTMQVHISEFEVGTYKKAHRHGPGSHVTMLNGSGYTMMWRGSTKYSEAETKVRVDVTEGSLFVPPDGWFHQHFNTGPEPARYLAATWGGDGSWFMRGLGGGGRTHRLSKTSTRIGGNLIEYADEDPALAEIYAAELKRAGIPLKMPGKRS